MCGLAGKTDLEKAQADEIVDAVNDLFNARVAVVRETDEVKKTEMTKTLMSETIPNTLVILRCIVYQKCIPLFVKARLEARLEERGGQFFVGNILTWADLHLFAAVEGLGADDLDLLDACPKIKNLIERIKIEPNIAKWLQSRPKTLF